MAAFAVAMISACDIKDTIDEANADAEQRARGRAAVENAIPQITTQIMTEVSNAMGEAMTAATAPKFAASALRPAATSTGSIAVNATATPQGGGTVTVTGKIDWTINADQTTETIHEGLALSATWDGIPANFNGTQYPTKGNETIEGSMDVSIANGAATWSGKYYEKGSITMDGATYTFDIAIMVNNSGATYSGTVNGEPVSGTVTMPSTEVDTTNNGNNGNTGIGTHGTADAGGMSCDFPQSNGCVDFVGAGWTTQAVGAGCSNGTRVASCTSTNRIGRCVVNEGANMDAAYNWYGDASLASQYQTQCTGTWTAN
jgi:hypothetical protein